LTDEYASEGAPLGAEGWVIEVYDDASEVEVSDPATGLNLFLGAVPDDRLEGVTPTAT
jgi:hypothetical protein